MSSRIWLGGGVIAIVGVLAGGWFLGAQPLLAQAAASDAERQSVAQLNAVQEARLAELQQLSGQLTSLERDAATLGAALPDTPAMSAFVGELSTMSGDAGVQVTSLTVGEAVLVSEAAAAAGAAGETAPAETEAAAESAPADPAAAPAPAPAGSDLTTLAITLSATGDLDALTSFLERLHSADRLVSVAGATVAEDGNGGFRLDLTGAVYMQTPAA